MKKAVIYLIYTICVCQIQISYSQIASNMVSEFLHSVHINYSTDYAVYLKKIDSIMRKEYSPVYQKEIIKKLVRFKKNSNEDIRSLVTYWLSLFVKDKRCNLEIRQLAAFHKIDMLYFCCCGIGESYTRNIYNKKIIKRMVELLKGMSEEERQMNLKSFIELDTANIHNIEQVQKLMKKRNISKEKAWDMYIKKKSNFYDSLICKPLCNTYFKFPLLIKTLGWLDVKECIPILKDMLKDSSCSQSKKYKEAIYYALARMGDKEMENQIFQWRDFDFIYFKSKEACLAYLNSINETDYEDWSPEYSEGEWPQSNSAIDRVIRVTYIIENFPEHYFEKLKEVESEEDKEKANNLAKQAIQWIIENKDNLQLRDYEYIYR